MTDHPDIKYLKQDHIGKVIAQGLSEVYQARPKFPVDYLARWLLNYAQTQKNLELDHSNQKIFEEISKQHEQEKQIQLQLLKTQEENLEASKNWEKSFFDQISGTDFHDTLLDNFLCDQIKHVTKVTGAYIGIYDILYIKIDPDQDDDPMGHLDPNSKGQFIQYIGFSKEDAALMRGKKLPKNSDGSEKGVTYDLFNKQPDAAPDQGNQNPDGGDDKLQLVKKRTSSKYIGDVIAEPRMFFFQIPKMGAYLAIKMTFQSFMNPNAYEKGIEKLQSYQAAIQEWKSEDSKLRLEYENEKNKAGDDEQRLQELEQTYQELFTQSELKKPEAIQYDFEEKSYVFACDTLGQDQGISKESIEFIERACEHFVDCWENSERRALEEDLQSQIDYSKDPNFEKTIEQFNVNQETYLNAIKDADIEAQYQQAQNKFQQSLTNLQEYKKDIQDELVKYRFVRYSEVLQIAMLLIGKQKHDFNIADTYLLNWRKVKSMLTDDDFFNPLFNYKWQGKEEKFPNKPATVNRLKKRLESFQEWEKLDRYNIGLGRLCRYIQDAINLREQDILYRRAKYNEYMKDREDKIAQRNQTITDRENQLGEAKQVHKDNNPEEEFDEEKWLEDFNAKNQIPEIPQLIELEVDNDYEIPYNSEQQWTV